MLKGRLETVEDIIEFLWDYGDIDLQIMEVE